MGVSSIAQTTQEALIFYAKLWISIPIPPTFSGKRDSYLFFEEAGKVTTLRWLQLDIKKLENR